MPLETKKVLGKKVDTSKPSGHLKKHGAISELEKQALLKHGHHVEHTPEDEAAFKQPVTYNKTMTTDVWIPEERLVKVPVVRKEKEKVVEKHTIKGSKLVPVTKHKEVLEIGLHDRPVVPGERARTGCPKTQVLKTSDTAGKTRMIPYTDFEEQECNVTVDVPRERVMTRVGHRMDKQLHSHCVRVEEDCVFEMRPVLIKKGEARAKELVDKDWHGKAVHGDPVWEGLHDGWHPEFGCSTPTGSRPGTGLSVASRPGTGMSRRPDTGMAGSPTGARPIREFTGRPASRGGTGMSSSAPNLHAARK